MNKLIVGAAALACVNLLALGVMLSMASAPAANTIVAAAQDCATGPSQHALTMDTGSAVAIEANPAVPAMSVEPIDPTVVDIETTQDASLPLDPQLVAQWSTWDAGSTQAYVGDDQAIVRVGIQKTDCGCCAALQDELRNKGYRAEFSYTRPTNEIEIHEHMDRCRMVTLDGVPMQGYSAFELGRIVDAKFRGDLPKRLAHTRNQARDVDPREAKGYRGEKSLIVSRQIPVQ